MDNLKVIHVNHSDINGGAARAAYRIHNALRLSGVDSRMWVNHSTSGDWTVEGIKRDSDKIGVRARPFLANLITKALRTTNPITHSPSIFPSKWVKQINQSEADLVHLHWIQGEMISIADIGRIKKPIVWTLHDMWAFCGAEHYTNDFRWRDGYTKTNRPIYESGFDLNRWTWNRKVKNWKFPIHIVTSSRWLAQCVRDSKLMSKWPLSVIPYPIDLSRWSPVNQNQARELLGLPIDTPLLLFGAIGGGRDPRKGYDLLEWSLDYLRKQIPDLQLVIFGQLAPKSPINHGFSAHYLGHLHDDISLRFLYSAADVMVVPSRQEAFGQTASEAHACGTPVVAFNIGGLPDIIDHKTTGYLAKPFNAEDLANGIHWVINNSKEYNLRENARAKAEDAFAPEKIASQYIDIYLNRIK